jgi:hypothetical protein
MTLPQIVTVNVTQQVAPSPSTLQKTGAIISQGATVTSRNTLSLLTQLADLTPLLVGAKALASLTWANGFVTATTAVPHGYTVGDAILLTFVGCTPTGYNGTYLCTITGASTFTYVRTNPGSLTVAGSYTPEDVVELVAMATTHFSQGSSVPIYVMEVGAESLDENIAVLDKYLDDNPETLYGVVVPRDWDAVPSFLALVAKHENTTSKFYFWVTTSLQTRGVYTDLMKDVWALVEAPQQSIFQQNAITALSYEGEQVPLSATIADPGTGIYHPNDVLTALGGSGPAPTFSVVTVKVLTATVVNGGSGGTNGPVTITGTTGTGTRFQATGTISGNALTGALVVTVPGSYTLNPTNVNAEPVTGGGLTGATVNLQMVPLSIAVLTRNQMHVVPDNPVNTSVSPSGGLGCTLNITWQQAAERGRVIITTTTNHGVSVGDLFQLAGMTPNGFNTYYTADAGTTGSTLIARIYTNPGPVTVLGTLLESSVVSSAPPSTEFTIAAPFWNALHLDPSSSNKVPPFAFQDVFGVTNWVAKGTNRAILGILKDEGINYITTGAEGGISNSSIFWGTVRQTPRDFTYWYSVDWAQLDVARRLANVIINGSNNPINPLYYDQEGIDRLQDAAMGSMQSAVSYGLANGVPTRSRLSAIKFIDALENGTYDGKLVVNAEPLLDYLRVNPNDYKIGRYAGLFVGYIPQRGFIHILFNMTVTDFLVAP